MNWRGPERSRTVERALLLVLAKVPLWSLWYKNKYRELYLECGSLLPLFFSWSCHSALAFSRTPYPGALFCTSENHNSFLFMGLPTFGQKHPRGGVPPTTSAKALARKTRNGVRAGGNQSQNTSHESPLTTRRGLSQASPRRSATDRGSWLSRAEEYPPARRALLSNGNPRRCARAIRSAPARLPPAPAWEACRRGPAGDRSRRKWRWVLHHASRCGGSRGSWVLPGRAVLLLLSRRGGRSSCMWSHLSFASQLHPLVLPQFSHL